MEKREIVFPITEENFPQAWAWADLTRRRMIRRKAVRKISGAVGNLAFFVLMCVVLFGFFLQQEGVYFQEFLRKIPMLPQLWDWLLAHIFKPELKAWGQLGIIALLLLGIPMVLEGFVSGIVRLLCRPKERLLPEGTAAETSQLLLEVTQRLLMSKKATYVGSNTWHNMLFLLLGVGVISAFTFVTGLEGNEELLADVTAAFYSIGFYILIIGCWMGYAALAYILMQLTRLLYIVKLPQDLLEQVREFSLRCDPEKKARLEEEDRILALAEEIKHRRAQEKAALLAKK